MMHNHSLYSEYLQDDEIEEGENTLFSEINITPFTDVILVLLIVFMVYAATAVTETNKIRQEVVELQDSGLNINLPQGKVRELDAKITSLSLNMLVDGTLFIAGKKIITQDITSVLRDAAIKNPKIQLILHADGDVSHKKVVTIMEQARQAGITQISIATDQQ